LPNKKEVRLLIRNFVKSKAFIHHLYSNRKRDGSKTNYPIVSTGHYGWWNKVIAESLIKKASYPNYLIYIILRLVPFENVKRNKVLMSVYVKMKR
jgi:hypothetical protein